MELSCQQERENDEYFNLCIISHSISVININSNTSCLSLHGKKRKVGESMHVPDNYDQYEAYERRLSEAERAEEAELLAMEYGEIKCNEFRDEEFIHSKEQ